MVRGVKTPEGVIYEVETGPPINTSLEDPDNQRFKEDDFRMLYMKVLPCSVRRVHDWTLCNFTHPGEKIRRRDPQTHSYTGIACPDMKKTGLCVRGKRCPYAHNVFEYWLHPTRYRSQLCNDGPKCRRNVCFFAHNIDELRVPPSKPYVAPDMLVEPPEPEAAEPQTANMVVGPLAANPAKPRKLGQVKQPYLRSPVAAHEPPPVRNMSASALSTSGSLELDASQSAGSFISSQSVSFAPPEGFTNVDTWAVVISKSPPSEPATSALQEVAAGLASVKSAIMSDAADRNQAIDMLTNLLRETLQETTAAISHDASTASAFSKTASAFANPILSAPGSKPDLFSTAAERTLGAPRPKEEAALEAASGAPNTVGSATLAALPAPVMSAELSLTTPPDPIPVVRAHAPAASQPLAVVARPLLAGEGLMKATQHQSSMPSNTSFSIRAAASTPHAARAQPARVAEVAMAKPPSGLSGSVGQQQQAAVMQQQTMQQLQMRRAAQYGGCGGRVLQGLSNFVGSPDQNLLRSLSADVRQLPDFAGSSGQVGALSARDLLYPNSFVDAYQLDVDSSQGSALSAVFLSGVDLNQPLNLAFKEASIKKIYCG
ncbi:g4040 [Coccomyxa viridis]|uniref:G4040 protein n=1 Tax=Coccomyxa viridis TaxID=1274662 RepID=A0ABP1FQU6_9CHLO